MIFVALPARPALLLGRLDGDIIHVWCPFCRKEHRHGWVPGETKATHRVAHCFPDSPFTRWGYFIMPRPKKLPLGSRTVREPWAVTFPDD